MIANVLTLNSDRVYNKSVPEKPHTLTGATVSSAWAWEPTHKAQRSLMQMGNAKRQKQRKAELLKAFSAWLVPPTWVSSPKLDFATSPAESAFCVSHSSIQAVNPDTAIAIVIALTERPIAMLNSCNNLFPPLQSSDCDLRAEIARRELQFSQAIVAADLSPADELTALIALQTDLERTADRPDAQLVLLRAHLDSLLGVRQ